MHILQVLYSTISLLKRTVANVTRNEIKLYILGVFYQIEAIAQLFVENVDKYIMFRNNINAMSLPSEENHTTRSFQDSKSKFINKI